MKEGGMEQAEEKRRQRQNMSPGVYHHLLPPQELNLVPFKGCLVILTAGT